MKSFFLISILSIITTYQTIAQDSNKIESIAIIEVINDNFTVMESDTIALDSIYRRLNKLLKENTFEANIFPSVTLVVNPSVTENSIENIKYQIRSTPVQLINLQRKTINTYDGTEVTQNVLDQYNSLIKYWNSLKPEERFYRKTDLNFVESVALNMTLDQRIRNQKLPGYLPFVKQETKFPALSLLDIKEDENYLFITKTDTLSKEQAFKNYGETSFYQKKRVINEENVNVIELDVD